MSTEDIRRRIEELSRPDVVRHELPNWGTAYFRRLSAEARFQILAIQEEQSAKGQSLPAAVAIAVTLCDETGTLVYADLADGLKAINALPVEMHDELAVPALTVSGLRPRALEEAEKKS